MRAQVSACVCVRVHRSTDTAAPAASRLDGSEGGEGSVTDDDGGDGTSQATAFSQCDDTSNDRRTEKTNGREKEKEEVDR